MTLESRLAWIGRRLLLWLQPTRVDLPLLIALMLLAATSLAVVWSAGAQDPDMLMKQGMRFALGFVLLGVCMRIRPPAGAAGRPGFTAAASCC